MMAKLTRHRLASSSSTALAAALMMPAAPGDEAREGVAAHIRGAVEPHRRIGKAATMAPTHRP